MSTAEEILPVWDMTTVFPSMDSAEFKQGFEAVTSGIDALATLFDSHSVAKRATPEVDDAFVAAYEEIISAVGTLQDKLRTLAVYISCFSTTNANDELAKANESLLNTKMVVLSKLTTRLNAWVGSSDVETLIAKSETAKSLEYAARRAAYLAAHQMPAGEEDLASELASPGISGWAKLHANLTALLTACCNIDFDRSGQGWSVHLTAECRFPRRYRQLHTEVASISLIKRVHRKMYG